MFTLLSRFTGTNALLALTRNTPMKVEFVKAVEVVKVYTEGKAGVFFLTAVIEDVSDG